MKWFDALKKWNASKGSSAWCIPKKGTKEHDTVKGIMEGKPEAPATPAKPVAPVPPAKPVAPVPSKQEITMGELGRFHQAVNRNNIRTIRAFLDAYPELKKDSVYMLRSLAKQRI